MAIGVLIIGGSGTGKSDSLRNLNPKETVIIKVYNKMLPFPEVDYPENHIISTDKTAEIGAILKGISKDAPHIKRVVIDDSQYIAANEFMRRSKEKTFDKFTDIGKNMWQTSQDITNLRNDLIVYQLLHDEDVLDADGYRKRKAKTIGKLVDEKLTFEGMYTIVIFTEVRQTAEKQMEYNFVTQNVGNTTAKTPRGMFEDLYIPNDLNAVDSKIREFYKL